MKEGDNSFEVGKNEVFINETLAKRMNMDSPVGKFIEFSGRNRKRIKGVVCDFQTQDPNTPVVPMVFNSPSKDSPNSLRYIAFKYGGDWNSHLRHLRPDYAVLRPTPPQGNSYPQGTWCKWWWQQPLLSPSDIT